MEASIVLEVSKKAWDLAHLAGGSVIKNDAGEKYLILQGATGNALISITEQKDTIDEILVGLVGDVVQGFLISFLPIAGTYKIVINVSSIATGEGLGNELKDYYKYIKRDINEQKWEYLENWEATLNDGVYNPIPYAKVAMHKDINGNWIPYTDNLTGSYVFETISKTEYDNYKNAKLTLENEINNAVLDTTIENINGIFKVTLPNGEIVVEGDINNNDIYGGDKNDYIYGGLGNDFIDGNEGDDYIDGGDGNNELIGYDGNDTILAGKGDDIIFGGDGNDTIEAGTGTNYIDGGIGFDTISYKNITNSNKEGITLNLSLATAQTINSTTTDTLVNIENVIGSKYDDFINFDNTVILKDKKTHILEGYEGSDKIYGAYNSVNVIYGNTKEEPFGSKGIFNFGSNRDEYGNIIKYDDWLYGGKTTNEELLASGNLTENHLYGGSGDDFLLVGYNAHNYLYGGAGEDTLVSAMIGFKNESAGIDFSYGSSYLNGGEGFDTYSVKDHVTIEDDDGRGEIETKYGKLQDLTIKTLSDGTILLLKNNPMYLDIETIYAPLAGYGSGAFKNILGNVGITTQGMSLTNYELIFKLQKDGNDLVLNDLSSNPTIIRIKNYTANSLNINITQDMLDNLPSLDENINPTPANPTLIGTNEIDTLIGSNVNNTFISNAGDDSLKDISGGNDIYKFKKGDGADTIYDIKGNDTIIFDETVLKEDITFSQSDDLKSLIINYSPTDSITITNYFDSFSKIENIQLSTGEKLIPELNTQTIGSNQSENLITGYGNDTVTSNAGNDTIKDLNGNDTYIFKVGDGNDIIEDLDGIDKIVFENLSNEDLIFTQKDNNLIIHYSINDSVTILNYFDNTTSNYLEKIAFKNDLETIDASNIITGTINDDEINGTYFDDVITSNKGNDTLKGFYGNDTYKFSKGDGNNRIYDVKGDDTIAFDESVKKEDISFIIKDNNLLITIFEYEKSVA